jgi:hypothetical protein
MAHQSNRSAPLYGIRCSRSAMRPHQTGAPTHNRHQDDTRRRKRRANLSATLKCFLVVSGSGAGLWAALALGAGWLLQGAVQGAISVLDQHAGGALLITTGLVASWLGWKMPAPIQAARYLLDAGYHAARPLQGGYETWMAANAANADSPGETIKP